MLQTMHRMAVLSSDELLLFSLFDFFLLSSLSRSTARVDTK